MHLDSIVIQNDQGFWRSMFSDYGLKGTWQLFTLQLTSPNPNGFLTLSWLNGTLDFFIFFTILNMFLTYGIFRRTKQAFEKNTPTSEINC